MNDAQKIYDMSVMALVPHVEMWPYVPCALIASLAHAATAACSSDLVANA